MFKCLYWDDIPAEFLYLNGFYDFIGFGRLDRCELKVELTLDGQQGDQSVPIWKKRETFTDSQYFIFKYDSTWELHEILTPSYSKRCLSLKSGLNHSFFEL